MSRSKTQPTAALLAALREHGTLTAAAKYVGLGRSTVGRLVREDASAAAAFAEGKRARAERRLARWEGRIEAAEREREQQQHGVEARRRVLGARLGEFDALAVREREQAIADAMDEVRLAKRKQRAARRGYHAAHKRLEQLGDGAE